MGDSGYRYVIVHPRNSGFGGYVAFTDEPDGVRFVSLQDPLDRDSDFEIPKEDALWIDSTTYNWMMDGWDVEDDGSIEFERRVIHVLREIFGIEWLGNG